MSHAKKIILFPAIVKTTIYLFFLDVMYVSESPFIMRPFAFPKRGLEDAAETGHFARYDGTAV